MTTEKSIQEYVLSDADILFVISDDSMNGDRIRNGDIVLVKECHTVENGDIAVALINDEARIGRFQKGDNYIALVPSSSCFESLVFFDDEIDNICIIGKAVGFMSAISREDAPPQSAAINP